MSKLNNPLLFDRPGLPIRDWPDDDEESYSTRITLRDLFAAAALAGMHLSYDYSHGTHNEMAADRSYALADAMLAEREGPGDE